MNFNCYLNPEKQLDKERYGEVKIEEDLGGSQDFSILFLCILADGKEIIAEDLPNLGKEIYPNSGDTKNSQQDQQKQVNNETHPS